MLMIHGTGASAHSWAALAEKLSDRFTLIMPDLPGQGFSSPLPAEEICIEGFARRLQGLLAALGVPLPAVPWLLGVLVVLVPAALWLLP